MQDLPCQQDLPTELSLGNSGAVSTAAGDTLELSLSGSIAHTQDCAGTYYGDAEDLGCGCNEAAPSGCDNACGSTATVDDCGVCGGSGIPEGACDCDGNVNDCLGECGGDAVIDECGVCAGDNSSCWDCAGIPNGNALEDNCGTCDSASIVVVEKPQVISVNLTITDNASTQIKELIKIGP